MKNILDYINKITGRPVIRNLEGDRLQEIFLVTAVASVLAIRAFLDITGYPKVGGEGLHIAHVLVGGVFMLISIILLLSFIDRSTSLLAAVFGGFGFGAFIDELGKFVTSDNNYFFQPTIALIYVVFIVIYLVVRSLNKASLFTEQEQLINAIEIAKYAVIDEMSVVDRQRSLELLKGCDQSDPIVKLLRDMLATIGNLPPKKQGAYTRIRESFARAYKNLIAKPWFTGAVMGFFIIYSAFAFLITLAIFGLKITEALTQTSFDDLGLNEIGLADWFDAMASAAAALYVLSGLHCIKKDRLKAYNRFKTGALIQLFFVQVLDFYSNQFWGLFGLSINLLLIGVLQYMIEQEERSRLSANSSQGDST
jgi:hypothetical protein